MKVLFINLHSKSINFHNYLIRGYDFTETKTPSIISIIIIIFVERPKLKLFFYNYLSLKNIHVLDTFAKWFSLLILNISLSV